VSIVIVNYNGRPWLEACLESLLTQVAGLAHELIVVDNASQDGSVALVDRFFPRARLIVNPTNLGFARANNQGIAQAGGRYVLLLNNDTVFKSGLGEMVAFLDQHPECGAVGPAMLDGQGAPRGSWGYFPGLGRLAATMLLVDRWPIVRSRFRPLLVRPSRPEFFRPAHPVDWASAACLLVRREALERVGPLDTNYFMYNEDLEWCYRAWQAGYQVWLLPTAQLLHYGAGGQEWRHWKGPAATLNAYKSFLTFYHKHMPAWQGLPLRLVLAAGAGLRLLGGVVLYASERGGAREQARQVIATYWQALRLGLGLESYEA
jgi:N-acetylglucosaminyl-diphospho-decaprenol L-rhamnosyltransferase